MYVCTVQINPSTSNVQTESQMDLMATDAVNPRYVMRMSRENQRVYIDAIEFPFPYKTFIQVMIRSRIMFDFKAVYNTEELTASIPDSVRIYYRNDFALDPASIAFIDCEQSFCDFLSSQVGHISIENFQKTVAKNLNLRRNF